MWRPPSQYGEKSSGLDGDEGKAKLRLDKGPIKTSAGCNTKVLGLNNPWVCGIFFL
jgi:hypothetical protein